MKDLIVIAADKDMEQTLYGLLNRHQSFQLAQQVSFKRCQDPSFSKMKETLFRWFG